MDKLERSQTFHRACQAAQAAVREVIAAEHQDQDALAFQLTESPLKPWMVGGACSLLIYNLCKTAFLAGTATGTGILISRLPTDNDSLIRWSSPVFVTVCLRSFGVSFGRATSATFAVGMSREGHTAVVRGHGIAGLDMNCGFCCGARVIDRPDVISANFVGDSHMVGVTKVSGGMVDLSFSSGRLEVDGPKHEAVYGNLSPTAVLAGAVEAPAEMQPLYAELSLMVCDCERATASPARVSASLERYSTGYDPDRVIVGRDGQAV